MVICSGCSAEVSAENEFCTECGFPMTTLEPVICPDCGTKVVFSSDACPVCGLPLEKLADRLSALDWDGDKRDAGTSAEGSDELERAPAVGKEGAAVDAVELAGAGTEEDQEHAAAWDTELTAPMTTELEPEEIAALTAAIPQMVDEPAPLAITSGGESDNQALCFDELRAEVARIHGQLVALQETMVSTELLQAVAAELSSATARVEAGQKSLPNDLAAQIAKAKSSDAVAVETPPSKPGEIVDYLFYLVLAILLFTVINTLIAAYLVRMVR